VEKTESFTRPAADPETHAARENGRGQPATSIATERVQSPPFSKRKLIDIRAQRPAGMLHRDKSTNRTIIQSAFALSLSLSRNCWKRESFQGCGQCSKKSQKTRRDVYCNLRPRNCPIRASGFDLGGLAVVNLAIRQMPYLSASDFFSNGRSASRVAPSALGPFGLLRVLADLYFLYANLIAT